MIRINLIPFRAARKKENVRRQVTIASLTILLIILVMAYSILKLNSMINNLNTEIQNTKNELAKVEKQAKEVDRIKNELNKLEQKIKVIANLEANRKASVKLLDDMTKMVVEKRAIPTDTPEGESSKPAKRLWFTRFEANGNTIIINGIALDNKTVADFMTRLEVSKLFTNVNLQMLKQQKVNRLNLKSFSITCNKVPLTK